MYTRIGHKLQVLAKVLCVLGILASIGCAMFCWVNASNVQVISTAMETSDISLFTALSTGSKPTLIVMGFVSLIGGSLLSWIASWTTYAFGQLVEDARKIAEQPKGTRGTEGR